MSFQEQADCALPIAKRLRIEVLERKSGADAQERAEARSFGQISNVLVSAYLQNYKLRIAALKPNNCAE
jgi:hypothetical protein